MTPSKFLAFKLEKARQKALKQPVTPVTPNNPVPRSQDQNLAPNAQSQNANSQSQSGKNSKRSDKNNSQNLRNSQAKKTASHDSLYAGAAFQNSPLPSALPLPVFGSMGSNASGCSHPKLSSSFTENQTTPSGSTVRSGGNANMEPQQRPFPPAPPSFRPKSHDELLFAMDPEMDTSSMPVGPTLPTFQGFQTPSSRMRHHFPPPHGFNGYPPFGISNPAHQFIYGTGTMPAAPAPFNSQPSFDSFLSGPTPTGFVADAAFDPLLSQTKPPLVPNGNGNLDAMSQNLKNILGL
jgi:hypothetical protein